MTRQRRRTRHIREVKPGDIIYENKPDESDGRGVRWSEDRDCLVIANAVMPNLRGNMAPDRRLLLYSPELGLFTHRYSESGYIKLSEFEPEPPPKRPSMPLSTPTSLGFLRYVDENGKRKVIVELDPGLVHYARTMIPPAKGVKPPRYPAHITIVSVNEGLVPGCPGWGDYEGWEVRFTYNPQVRNDETYWWLEANSGFLHHVRDSLGLDRTSEWSRPPDGADCFHITVGNTK